MTVRLTKKGGGSLRYFVVSLGAVGLDHWTVKSASRLVTLPPALLTTTEKSAPLSLEVVGGVV